MTKEQIIQAIRDTADKNGGVALGMKRFEKETGIGTHIWRGKHWLRWSEAVTEAGLTPNTLSEAYDDNSLFQKLCDLTRRFGHFPTYGEIRLAKSKDPQTPNYEAFQRLGSKAEQITRLRAWLSQNRLGEDVIALLPSDEGDVCAEPDIDREENVEGFVYMIKHSRHYKIGRTSAVPRRHREISLELPETTTIIHYIRTDDPEGIEGYWHNRFSRLRTNGEWFLLGPKEIRAFKKRKFM